MVVGKQAARSRRPQEHHAAGGPSILARQERLNRSSISFCIACRVYECIKSTIYALKFQRCRREEGARLGCVVCSASALSSLAAAISMYAMQSAPKSKRLLRSRQSEAK